MIHESIIGKQVRRKPEGRMCRVTAVDIDRGTKLYRVRIRDHSFWHGWVTEKVFNEKWEVLA